MSGSAQAQAGASVPFVESGTVGREDGRRPGHQPWCQAQVPAGAQTCPRCGGFQLRNRRASTHEATSRQRAEELAPVMRAQRAKILRQLGKTERSVPPVKSLVVDCLVREFLIAEGYFKYLAARPAADAGTLSVTTKGRVSRAATHHGASVDRIIRLAALVGLEHATRRGRRPSSAMDALRAAIAGDGNGA